MTQKVVIFVAGNEEYALPIENVLSIEKPTAITQIPHVPEYVKGMAMIRDELVPLLSIQSILYPNRQKIGTSEGKWIVIHTDLLSVGLIVGDAKEILEIPEEAIKQIGPIGYRKTEYVNGVASLGSRLITIIDPIKLIASLEGMKELQEYVYSH